MEPMNLQRFGIMLDCSRNGVMSVESVKRFIDTIVKMNYNTLLLYTEDTYEIKSQPYFGHNRGRYSIEEIKEIDKYAISKGIELIPCIQTLAHLERIFRWGVYGKVHDIGPILLADEEETYKLIDDMFASLAESYTSRVVNIGMDEAHNLGRGTYLDRHGLHNRFDILIKHLNRVSEIAKKYGFSITMWGDMFLGSDLFVRLMQDREYTEEELWEPAKKKHLIPDNVNIVYWDYYSTKSSIYDTLMTVYSTLKDDVWFAGGLWSWTGFAPHNGFSETVTELAFENCRKHGIKNIFLTMWGDDGNECSKFSLLPSMYYASQLVKGVTDKSEIKSGFKKEFGIDYDEFSLLDLTGTQNTLKAGPMDAVFNAEKYLLYNDCFMGLFDTTVANDTAENYGKVAEKLDKLVNNSEYGYLFETMRDLSRVLAIKADLGVKTRRAYEAKDKTALNGLVAAYNILIDLLEKFYASFEAQWMKDNKPQGFEVQDIRIGGLIRRVIHCKNRILQFVNGLIPSICELEEPMLDGTCRQGQEGKPIQYNSWSSTVTTSGM